MFENVDGRTPDAGVTGILIAHLRAFGSGELKSCHQAKITYAWICVVQLQQHTNKGLSRSQVAAINP